MADEPLPSQQAGALKFEKAETFRTMFNNFLRYRVGAGDFTIVLGTIVDGQPGYPNTVREEIAVAMSWIQLKNLAATLGQAIAAIEQKVGPIPTPNLPEAARRIKTESIQNQVDKLLLSPKNTELETKIGNG